VEFQSLKMLAKSLHTKVVGLEKVNNFLILCFLSCMEEFELNCKKSVWSVWN
jgi:hypothetical protein